MAETKYPFVTGYCGTGAHEGMRPKTPSGKPRKTCPRVIHDRHNHPKWSCECKCHKDLDMMFEMTGMERVHQDNPEYIPVRVEIILPTPEERAARFTKRDVIPPRVIQSPLPERVPVTIERVWSGNDGPRVHRGELELRVKKECDQWILDNPEESCTPSYISEKIYEKYGGKVPSVGAISAVFDRWTKLGFALIGKKPTRFVGYLPDGIKYGLEGLKERARREQLNRSKIR